MIMFSALTHHGFSKGLSFIIIFFVLNTASAQVENSSFEQTKEEYLPQKNQVLNSIKSYQQEYENASIIMDSFRMVITKLSLGDSYFKIGDYPMALNEYLFCHNLLKQTQYDSIKAEVSSKIGASYYFSDQGELEKAQDFYQLAYDQFMALNNTSKAALNLNYSAYVAWAKKDYNSCLQTHQEALKLFKTNDDTVGIATASSDIGFTLNSMGHYDEALIYHFKALKLERKLNDTNMMIPTLNNIGISYLHLNQIRKALEYSGESVNLAKKLHQTRRVKEASKTLSKAYQKLGQYEQALSMHQLFKRTSDSLLNRDRIKRLAQVKLKGEFDTYKEHMKGELKQQEILNQAEISYQKKVRNWLILFGGLIILFSVNLYVNFIRKTKRNKRLKQLNRLIKAQKHEVIEQHRNITDSINYAKRIQDAMLPNVDHLETKLEDGFVLYLPKDIVSGDFYWVEQDEHHTYACVADCTGHGIPGALVRMVCYSALTRAVNEFSLKMPHLILNKCRELVIEAFDQGSQDIYDGMDIALCCIENKTNKLYFAGANNPAYLIRNDRKCVEVIPADRQPIGKYSNPRPFQYQEVQLQKGDHIYLTSDGFADQFGGPKNKKFLVKRLKEYLLSNCHLSVFQQKKKLENIFTDWKADNEQIDDVCLMGLKV